MSFNRAKIQRFNEVQNHTPSPAEYNPKLKNHVGGAVISSTDRFIEQKSPAVSESASVHSINTSCFRTPILPKKKKSQTTPTVIKARNADIFSDIDGDALKEKIVECNNKDMYIKELTEQIEEAKVQLGKLNSQKELLENEKNKFEKFLEQIQEEHRLEIYNITGKYTRQLSDLQNEIIKITTELEFTQGESEKLKNNSTDMCNELIEQIKTEYEGKQNRLKEEIARMNKEMSLTKVEWNKLRASNRSDIEDLLFNISKFQKLNNVLTQTYNEEIKTKEEIIHKSKNMIIHLENELKELQELQRKKIEEIKDKHKNEIEDIEYEILKNITDMQKRFDEEKKVIEAMHKVKITNLENNHKEEIIRIQSNAESQMKRIEEDYRNANQLTKVQMEQEYKDKENEWKHKLSTQTEESEKILRECQALNEFKLMQHKVEKQHLVEELTEKLKESELRWQAKLEKQSKEADEILKECQAISEYNIIQCEIEKNDINRTLSDTLEDFQNIKVEHQRCLSEKEKLQKACDDLKTSYEQANLELREAKDELIKEREQCTQETQQLLNDKHTYEVTITKTRKTVEALTKRLLDSDKDVEQLKTELENCEKEKLDAEDKSNKLSDELKTMKKLYDELEFQNESNLKISQENIHSMEKKLSSKVAEFGKRAEESISNSNLRLQQKISEVEEIKEQLYQMQILNSDGQSLIGKANLELQKYEEHNTNLENKISILTEQLETSMKKVVDLEETNCLLRKKFDKQVICNSELKETLNESYSKNEEVEMLTKQLNQLQEKSDSYYQYCEYYKCKANEYEKEIEDMNNIHKKYIDQSGKYDELLQKYEELASTNAELEKTITEQESLIGPFREQLAAYKDELVALEIRKHNAENEAKQMGLKYAEMSGHQNHKQKIKHLVELRHQNNQLHEAKSELEQKVYCQSKTIEKLKKQLASLTKSPKKQKNVDKENVSLSSPLRDRN